MSTSEPAQRRACAAGDENGDQSRRHQTGCDARSVAAGRNDLATVRQRLTAALDAVPANDMDQAKALMAEAGDGFSIQLDCPNDRYINDEAICQAAVGMLGQIGITVNLDAKPKARPSR